MRTHRSLVTAVVGVCAAVHVALAAPPIAAVELTVRSVDPQVQRGRLVTFSCATGLTLAGDSGSREVPTADIVRVSTPSKVIPRGPRDLLVTLSNGDWLCGQVVGGGQDKLQLETRDLGRIDVALDALKRIDGPVSTLQVHEDTLRKLDRPEREDARNEDRLLLTNGDTLRGFVTAIDADSITVDSSAGETKVALRLVVAARLAGSPMPQPSGPRCVLTLKNSGRVTATEIDWSESRAKTQLVAGNSVNADPDRIVAIEVVGGRWVWLSSLRPISSEQTPWLAADWEYVPDANVLGEPLTVDGERFEHGLGVHSRSSLVFELAGEYREFVTSFGMDDDSGPWADVTISILVDGHRRFSQPGIRRGKLFGPVRVDVSNANRVELLTDFGDNGNVQDRFNWIETALVR